MSSFLLIFSGIMSSLIFSSFGVKPPPLAFSLILTAASRLLHPYSTNDKTSRLMVKRFSIVTDTQRGSQSYMEEEQEEEDRGNQEERGRIKRGKSNLASNQLPMCSLQSGTPREVHGVT